MDNIVKKTAAIYGIIGALITIGSYVYIWQTRDFDNLSIGIGLLIVHLILAVGAQIHSKKKLGGYLSLKQAVLAFVACAAIMFLSEAIINYLIYVVWDPAAQEQVAQMTAELAEQRRANSNQEIEEATIDYTIAGYAQAAVSKLLIYTVFGIIAGLIIKKNPPA
ncbi:DUF4199 domain-containing protein [Nonlabens ponticola]|uniref:DUF4199 domain-containing protein n=1 Tax=Nonlabens ponticola TaxID=2496866 RepID=A0A3S9MZH8_9FLAO|nr:DUF4199 domain-containing protein [Nonlabens ponticola]AZQ44580.1 DUF4199 domain-containing protein [Nonlabens ponticola]